MNELTKIAPAYLFLGAQEITHKHVIDILQQQLCSTQSACNKCRFCTQINEKQHHSVLWICPEKQYTLDELQPIFEKISFSLDHGEQYFFVLESADFLSPICANALLKSIEEPPPGYHFILLAHKKDAVLPTVQSRCIVKAFATYSSKEDDPLLTCFKTTKLHKPNDFLKLLESTKPNERTSSETIDRLFSFWLKQYKKAQEIESQEKKAEAEDAIRVLKSAYAQPLMPGSAKIFWKNLFLQMKR